MYRFPWYSLVIPLLATATAQGPDDNQQPLTSTFDDTACPDYASYAAYPQ